MTTVTIRAALFFMLAGWATCAEAQDKATSPGDSPTDLGGTLNDRSRADTPRQRFSFSKTADGVLRLDSETGQVSYCSARTIGGGCQAVPEDRAALETEIARLQDQVDMLNKVVADLRSNNGTLAAPRPPETVPPTKNGELKLPNREDLDRAKAFIEDVWRRLVDMLEQFRKDMRRT